MPLIYPGGDYVTVKVALSVNGFRVSDFGLAYRELESLGAQKSFTRAAARVTEAADVWADRRVIYTILPAEHLSRAICDVAIASWQVVDRVVSRMADEDAADIEEYLRARLTTVFGDRVRHEQNTVVGASTTEWEVSAVVQLPERLAVFHAVSNHSNSVFRTSTAFHDLRSLERPPSLVAVVREKAALGRKLVLLSQAGNVIETEQPDEVYVRAAA